MEQQERDKLYATWGAQEPRGECKMNTNELTKMQLRVMQLLCDWNTARNAADYRNELRALAKNHELTLEEFVADVFQNADNYEDDVEEEDWVMTLCREVVASKYTGYGMHAGPDCLNDVREQLVRRQPYEDMHPTRKRFWQAMRTYFRMWKMMGVGVK